MLKEINVGLMLLCSTGCVTASPYQNAPIPFKVASAGDDGLTQRMVAGLRLKLAAMNGFRPAARLSSTLIIIVPNVQSRQSGGISEARVEIRFSKLLKNRQLATIKTTRVSCWEDDLSLCFEKIGETARTFRK